MSGKESAEEIQNLTILCNVIKTNFDCTLPSRLLPISLQHGCKLYGLDDRHCALHSAGRLSRLWQITVASQIPNRTWQSPSRNLKVRIL
jgi:hypothetical protein